MTFDEPTTPAIATDAGALVGIVADDGQTWSFKGIPFAAPPVGDLRWRAPQPMKPWTGTLRADRHGPACIQPLMMRDQIMAQFGFDDPPETGMSEDCLYLNVWTPADAPTRGGLPVILWLYGGGHRVGSASHPVSDGARLAAKGAIVVALNYRLGALGYMAHPALTEEQGASGNYAVMDVIAGLEWIHRNIAAFGGDAGNVTLFGQSAGAAHICVLMASPKARGLFHKVVATSGGRFDGGPMGHFKSRAKAETEGQELCAKLGANTAEEIRSLPADQLFGPRGLWNIIIDGAVLTETVQSVFDRGEQVQVPVLAGFTADEATPYPLKEQHSLEAFRQVAEQEFGERASALLDLYGVHDDATAIEASYAMRRDRAFGFQAWKFAQQQAIHEEHPAWLFVVDRAAPLPQDKPFHEVPPPRGFGAYHGCDLWYLFDTLDQKPWAWTPRDRAIAEHLSAALIDFARTGSPGADWPRFDPSDDRAMVFGEQADAPAPLFNRASLRFFDVRPAA